MSDNIVASMIMYFALMFSMMVLYRNIKEIKHGKDGTAIANYMLENQEKRLKVMQDSLNSISNKLNNTKDINEN